MCVHLQIINIAIQLNTLQVGYVSTCRLLYGSGLMGGDNHPTNLL